MIEQGLERIGINTAPLRRVNWTKWILIALALGIALWIGLNAPRMNLLGRTGFEALLVVLVLVIAGALVLYRLELGVFAIIFSSYFIRVSLGTGTGSQIPISLVVSAFVVTIWVISMLLKRRFQLIPGEYVAPTLIFVLLSLISVPYSWLLLRPDLFGNGGAGSSGIGFTLVQLGGVTLMVLLPAVMLMTANVLKSERWFKLMFGIIVFVALPELLTRLGLFNPSFGGFALRTGASYALWVVALCVAQALFNDDMWIGWRVGLLGIAAIWLYYGSELGATWFSGWMPAAAAFLFITFMRSRKLFLVVLVFGLIMFALRADHYVDSIWNDAVNYDSNRFEIWQIIIFDLTLTKTNFFFGAGPAGYLPFYETYYPGNAWVSHNNYIDIFAEVGLVGFTVFLWMLWSIFHTGWKQRNKMPTKFLTGFNYGVLGGFIGTLMAMGLGDWHIPFVYNIGIPGFDIAVFGWLACGAMLALSQFTIPSTPADVQS